MNTVHGIIHDLANEETVIGGCTTPGEVIGALQGLVEENILLKSKLKKLEQAREEIAKYQSICDSYCEHIEKGDYWEGHTPNHYESNGGKATACDYFLQILDNLIESEVEE